MVFRNLAMCMKSGQNTFTTEQENQLIFRFEK